MRSNSPVTDIVHDNQARGLSSIIRPVQSGVQYESDVRQLSGKKMCLTPVQYRLVRLPLQWWTGPVSMRRRVGPLVNRRVCWPATHV
jgi:hypothetical protein